MSTRTKSRLLSVLLVIGAAIAALLVVSSGAPSDIAAQVGGRPTGPFIPPTKIGGSGGGGGTGDVTDVLAGTGVSVANSGGPQPTVSANLAGASCSAQSFMSALSATGTGTCTAIDNAYWQRRVSGTCLAGTSIRVINSDGTVTCETDDDTGFTVAGAALTSTGVTVDWVAKTNGGLVANANDAGLRADCGSGAVLKAGVVAGEWYCGTDDVGGGGGISGSGTTGTIPKWSSSSALTDSIMSESGSLITFAGSQLTTGNTQTSNVGVGTAPDANMGVKVTQAGMQYGYVAVGPYSGFSLGNASGFIADLQGTIVATSSREISGVYGSVTTTPSSGSSLTNIGLKCQASGGNSNYCYYGVTGEFYNAGVGSFGTTLGVGTNLTVGGTSLLTGNVNMEANAQLDSAGQLNWSSTGTAGGANDVALARIQASGLVVTDGAGTATSDYGDIFLRTLYPTTSVKTASGGLVAWSSTTAVGGSTDAALGRGGAGIVEVNNGTLTTYRDLLARTLYSTTSYKGVAASKIEWSSTSGIAGTTDTGFARNAAGVVEVNNGTAGTLRDITLRNITSSTTGTFNGNVVLGDASADTIGLNGTTTAAATLNTKGFLADDASNASCSGCTTNTAGKNFMTVTATTGTFTVTFSSAFTNTPTCVVSTRGGTKSQTYTVSTTAVSVASGTAGQVYDIFCGDH